MKKLVSIQMLRGIAASMVSIYHFTVGSAQYMAALPTVQKISRLGEYGVQVFFVISGFVLPFALYNTRYHVSSFGKFLIRRIIRIDPPFLASICVVIILGYASTLSPFYRDIGFTVNGIDLLLHLGYLNSFFERPWLNPVYWTLAIEFQFYILLGLLFGLFARSNNTIRAAIVIAFLALALLIPKNNLIFPHAPLFFMGIFSFFYFEKLIDTKMLLVSTAIFAVVGAFSYNWIGTLFGVLTVAGIIFWNTPSRAILFLGTISYSMYLLHVPFGTRITNLVEGRTENIYIRLGAIAAAFIFTLVVSWIFYRVIEKRSIEWSKKVELE